MTDWVRYKKGDCPICAGAGSGCRRSIETGLYFCHSSKANPIGFVFRGFDIHGFGLWQVEAEAERQSQQAKAERVLEQQQRAAAKERQKLAQISRQMGADERHHWYSKLLEQLPLDVHDQADLERRGFTPEQIERDGYRSVYPWQSVIGRFPENFPGLTPNRKKLAVRSAGYLCPVRDSRGRIVGGQIRKRESQEGRYAWLSSKTAPVHLDGEIPVGFYEPEDLAFSEAIWLCEGVGAKPSLTRYRLNVPVVGAASGRFDSSPQLTETMLSRLAKRYKTSSLVIAVDAGDVANPQVMQRWGDVHHFLVELDYSVSFAWWGQHTKIEDDIDELADLSQIRLISWEELNAISKAPQQVEVQLDLVQTEIDEKHYQALTCLTKQPWKQVCSSELSIEDLELERGSIYVIVSAKGTGKTNALVPFIPQFSNVYAWFSRVALGRDECSRIGLTWKDELTSYDGFLKVGFCSDSAYQFNPRHLQKNGLLLVDEADQVFDHNFGDTCNKGGKRPLILNSLKAQIEAAIAGGGMCLFMSADIRDREVEYIEALAPAGVEVKLIVDHYQPELGTVLFDESETPDGVIDNLLAKLEAGTPCFVLDDMKGGVRGCKSIAEFVRRLHPDWESKIVEINADTSGNPEIIEFLEKVNTASKEVLLLICSPSVISGISIQNGRFNQGVYAFLNGILTCSEASQGIARVRGASEIRVWAAQRGILFATNRAADPAEVRDYYQRNYQSNCKHLLSFGAEYNPLVEEWTSPHFELFCKNAAYRNACMLAYRERFRSRLEAEGYTVLSTCMGGDEGTKTALKAAWYDLDLAHAQAVADAELLSDSELSAFLNNPNPPTPEGQLSIEKSLLLKRFGEEMIAATTWEHKSGEVLTGYAAMAIKNAGGQYQKRLDAFYLLNSEISEAIAKDLAVEQRQEQESGERFAGDVKWNTRKRQAREFLGLKQFLNPEVWFYPTDIEELAQKAKQHAADIKDVLNLAVKKLTGGQILAELLRQIGLDLISEQGPTSRQASRYRIYRISPESWANAQMYLQHRKAQKQQQAIAQAERAQATVEPERDHPPLKLLSTTRH